MINYGRTSVHEFLGDYIVYRTLTPIDPRLPPLAEIRSKVGVPEGVVPRKSEPAYARVIVHLLRQARALEMPGVPVERLIYVGDTRMNDSTAFTNICRAGDWPGLAFIGADRDEPARVELVAQPEGALCLANRWAALGDLDRLCQDRGLAIDERTAVVVDLDKTAVGARGRNDQVIDRARVEAVHRTVGALLGDSLDSEGFQRAYDLLKQAEFHPFTADNQDYLTYICLILGSDLYTLEPFVARVRAGQMTSFQQFIAEVDERAHKLPSSLRSIHQEIFGYVRQGDPTPFKAFRYNEYRLTVERMGCMEDGAPVARILAEELVITQEVREAALRWRAQGALLFGLSDKPDEASIPTGDLAAQGYRHIHQAETHAVGE